MKSGAVYILTNRPDGVLYTGVTSNLPGRIWRHRTSAVPGFAKRYQCARLVWYEHHDDLQAARQRELRIKEWRRDWKIALIVAMNPGWRDLFEDVCR